VDIRPLREDDVEAWLDLRAALWPDSTREEHAADRELVLGDPQRYAVLVADDGAGRLRGFAEVSLRDWAEGCESRPVGYLEGWYVAAAQRRRGVGRALLEAAERWCLARGSREIASDAEIDNAASHAAHAALGFREIGRSVLFAKGLDDPRPEGSA
jgi:aminoglycoside 6'-N-acetyltransferase I